MSSYEKARRQYKPENIKVLIIAESPPPEADIESSRHFYRADRVRKNDRLFINTIKALYPEAVRLAETDLEQQKETWLRRFQKDGWYMIEALEQSQPHEISKRDRQERIKHSLSRLIKRVQALANKDTAIILVKSNVFEAAAEPLRQTGFRVLNRELVDYPGQFNQKAYREKLSRLAKAYK